MRATLCVLVAGVVGVGAGPRPERGVVQAEVWRIAGREGVDPRLAEAVAETESAYDAWAVSPKGAVGVMQLMPRTAGALGVRDARDVEENVTAGVRYLKYLQWYYRGNLRLALAAYNAGPGAVSKYGGVPPYVETREYVTAVLERYYGVWRKVAPRAPKEAVQVAGGATVCGGSEMAYDSFGRLYLRARRVSEGCSEAPLR